MQDNQKPGSCEKNAQIQCHSLHIYVHIYRLILFSFFRYNIFLVTKFWWQSNVNAPRKRKHIVQLRSWKYQWWRCYYHIAESTRLILKWVYFHLLYPCCVLVDYSNSSLICIMLHQDIQVLCAYYHSWHFLLIMLKLWVIRRSVFSHLLKGRTANMKVYIFTDCDNQIVYIGLVGAAESKSYFCTRLTPLL